MREDVIERANGERGIYGVVDKDPGCIIIPLEKTPEGEFLYLVSQFRYTVGKRLMEFPQGTWKVPTPIRLPWLAANSAKRPASAPTA